MIMSIEKLIKLLPLIATPDADDDLLPSSLVTSFRGEREGCFPYKYRRQRKKKTLFVE